MAVRAEPPASTAGPAEAEVMRHRRSVRRRRRRAVALPEIAAPWAQPGEAIATALRVDPAHGLSSGEVEARRAVYGGNVLRAVRERSVFLIAIAQFKSFLVVLLVAAVAVAAAFGEWVEAGAIAAVLVINAVLGFMTELRAVRSMEALRKLGATRATVRRDGEAAVIPAADLVPGDIVVLDGGDVVTADLRVTEGSKLQADESTLTGESLPVEKSAESVKADAPLAERTSMLFKGTIVTRGTGLAVAVATGMRSELGKIAALVEETEEEITPLERRLNKLGQGLVWVTLVAAAIVIASGIAAGTPVFLMVETAIALAVATVPEGLPIIATIALARGMYRMAEEHAVVKRLSAVETLGATSIICTDKTGTLTENRMSVGTVRLVDPAGRRRALEIGALCNNASLGEDGSGVGDPLEVALLQVAAMEGIDRDALVSTAPERREVAFDSDLMMMATIHGREGPYRVAVKGAPEPVIAASTLTEDERARWLGENEKLAAEGLRVLALAQREVTELGDDVYHQLSFVGLVGLLDPPRTEVRQTLHACRRAGVRVVMVTGDHPVTASNIAKATGLVDDPEPPVILGPELERANAAAAAEQRRLLDASIFARVSPKQKLELIALHQGAGSIVAMTGDGVNDAPALRKADIGVAMGGRGTEAAKEAATMVLADDDLSTIAIAVRQGRVIFDNIRRFVVYLLSCNLSEVLVVGIAVAWGAPLPLLPLQILFLNLVTDVFPALALGVGEGDARVMDRPPRPAEAPVIGGRHWAAIAGYAVILTASVLGAFALALTTFAMTAIEAVTVSFLTLSLAQLWHVFNMRRRGSGLVRNEITQNPWVWGAVGLCVVLLGVATYVPPLAAVLALSPPSVTGWALIVGMSLLPTVLAQVAKSWLGQPRAVSQSGAGA